MGVIVGASSCRCGMRSQTPHFHDRRKTMRLWHFVTAGVVFAMSLLLISPGISGGGGGGSSHDCVDHWHHLDWAITCDRNRGCRGGCYKLKWLERNCIPGFGTCTPSTRTVTRIIYRANCQLSNPPGPVCLCGSQYTPIGPLGRNRGKMVYPVKIACKREEGKPLLACSFRR